ncbi:MAG: 16S rRNA (cytidine(1402)-2'-O)-methyltransferase [Rhodothermales bacterium]|nr:16S rRNA (cytidine(1402)-2'-O)-methyltransferase [Rhodothermales bacterium]
MLYIVPTPIGNLQDITLRALDVLKQVDLIACEDTRTSGKLLSHYGITTRRISYHDHNERTRTPHLIARMKAGASIALISDAGTPGISDPGFYLVRECHRHDVVVVPLPGPSAVLPALVASGIPSERFVFEAFLPPKKGRKARLQEIAAETRTVVFYESPHRILKTLAELEELCGPERPIAVARELTKKFEEVERGSIGGVRQTLMTRTKQKGEFVVVIGGAGKVESP